MKNEVSNGEPEVAAVVVTYNRLEKLKIALEKTFKQPFVDILIVNNASTDGTAGWLARIDDPRVKIVNEKENRGGAGGFASGLLNVISFTRADWIVLYDDDAYPESEAIEEFIDLAGRFGDDIGAVAAAVYDTNKKISSMNRPGINPFQSWRNFASAISKKKNRFGIPDAAYEGRELLDVSYSSFVGFFIRKKLIEGVAGLPRAELFIYADDTLYTLNLVNKGFRLLFAPSVRFVHDCATLENERRVYYPLWKAYYTFRNGILFYRELSGVFFYPIMLPLLIISWLSPLCNYRDRSRFLRLFIAAIRDGLVGDLSKKHQEIIDKFDE